MLQKSHGHASVSRGRLAARTCVSFARAASDSLMSYRVSYFSDSILDLSDHVSNFWVGEVRLTLQVSILFCFISQTFKLLQNFILGGSKGRPSGSHLQEQSKNLVPARSRLLEHSVWIKLTMWKPESMKCKSGCGLGTTPQAKECVTESHSYDPHSTLQLNKREFASWVCLQ